MDLRTRLNKLVEFGTLGIMINSIYYVESIATFDGEVDGDFGWDVMSLVQWGSGSPALGCAFGTLRDERKLTRPVRGNVISRGWNVFSWRISYAIIDQSDILSGRK
jgi:hypothetical protein